MGLSAPRAQRRNRSARRGRSRPPRRTRRAKPEAAKDEAGDDDGRHASDQDDGDGLEQPLEAIAQDIVALKRSPEVAAPSRPATRATAPSGRLGEGERLVDQRLARPSPGWRTRCRSSCSASTNASLSASFTCMPASLIFSRSSSSTRAVFKAKSAATPSRVLGQGLLRMSAGELLPACGRPSSRPAYRRAR